MTVASGIRAPWYRLQIAGDQVELAAAPTQNAALEGVVTTVLDAEIESVITFATNVAVTVDQAELIRARIAPQFAGVVNHVSAQSFPNRIVLTCVGPLARLRRCPQNDHDLTGMTDGEAVQYLLTSCGITFDAGDIADSGYVLGAQTPVLWLKDQAGHEVLTELDRVFGTATIEVGDGRVIRFAYDRAPDAANISRTYTRGVDAEFWGNQRDRGDLDAIVNLVQVRGATWTGSDKCSYTPWGRGSADNSALGTGVRNRSTQFSSDLIQDEALAGAVAMRLLRWYNRQPDELTLIAVNDLSVNCGDVIGVKDDIAGVALSGDATATPYVVLTIDRRGDEMTLSLIGGAAGSTGTVTTGVEKVCNQISSNFPIAGLFSPIGILTPFGLLGFGSGLPWAAYDCALHGHPGGEGVCPAACAALATPTGCTTSSTINGQAVSSSSWLMAGHITLTDPADEFRVGVTAPDGDYALRLGGMPSYLLGGVLGQQFQFIAASTVEHTAGVIDLGVDYHWVLLWDATAREFSMTITDGTVSWCESIDVPAGKLAGGTGMVTVSGTPTRSGEAVNYDCAGGGGGSGTGEWTPAFGNWDHSDTFAKFIGTDTDYSGYAYFDQPLDGSQPVTMTGHVALSGDLGDFAANVGLGGTDDLVAEAGFDWSTGSGESVYLESGWAGGGFDNPSVSSAVDFDFSITFDFDAGTISATFGAGLPTVVALGGMPAAAVYLFVGCSGNHHAMEMDVTDIVITVGP